MGSLLCLLHAVEHTVQRACCLYNPISSSSKFWINGSCSISRTKLMHELYWQNSWFLILKHIVHSTRPPFLTLLSRRARSCRWSYFGKRVWFTESHLVLIISFFTCFIYSIYCRCKIMEHYIQLNNYIISRKPTQSLSRTPTYTTLVRDWILTGLLASAVRC